MPKLLIFDFDGTIADSFDMIYDVISEYAKIKPNKAELRKVPTKIGVKHFRLSTFDLMKVIVKIIHEHNKNLPDLKCFAGIKDALVRLKEKSIQLVLLTSSGEKLTSFLANNSLDNLFDQIYRVNPFVQRSVTFEKIIAEHSIANDDVYYIADEARDVLAARKLGIKTVAVTWGFNDGSVLKEYEPSYLIDKPSELERVVSR